ncbi:MAG TPA: CoA pyrophosphatase [Solirubrobacteraceae bacterium]
MDLTPLLDGVDLAATAPAVDGHTQAAVLIPILADPQDDPRVVLTRRRADMRNHAGEISFPGGRREPADDSLIETALRESEEEIGLRREEVRIVGALTATSTFATKYAIHPFVGVIASASGWTLSPLEVDAILELPLRELSASRGRVQLTRRGYTFETDAFLISGETIWGATARILDDLLQRVEPLLGNSA